MTSASNPLARKTPIHIHTDEHDLALIDRAAALLGKTRAEFMVESARHAAESVLLNRTLFVAEDAGYKQFVEFLDVSPVSTGALSTLLRTAAPWE